MPSPSTPAPRALRGADLERIFGTPASERPVDPDVVPTFTISVDQAPPSSSGPLSLRGAALHAALIVARIASADS